MKVVLRCPPELADRLPRPQPARHGLPDWLKDMAATAPAADLGFDVRTVKQCPPFVDAMAAGFLVPLATDLRVSDGRFEWDWDLPPSTLGAYSRSPIGVHDPGQAAGTPLFDPDAVIVKFTNFWTVELPAGWSLLCLHPVNRADLPFRTLTGLVDADRYCDGLIHFPAVWTDPGFDGVLARGTPVAQCVPVPREPLELVFDQVTDGAADRFRTLQRDMATDPGVYRQRYRVAKR